MTSFLSMTLTYLLFSLLTSCFVPPLSPCCSWEVLQDLASDHLPILLTVPLSGIFCPNERLPSFNFQKACWDDFAFYFDSHFFFAEEYLSLSLSFAAALTINFKPDGQLKWKKRLVKEARLSLQLTEVMKIVRLQFPLPDMPRLSSPRWRHGSRLSVVVVVYPTPSEGWGYGGRPWSPRSWTTPQGLDQRS